jgi:RsiW-degrading membrane proteinase PrsW (M82 family)
MSMMQNYGVLRVVRGNHGSDGKFAKLEPPGRENIPDRALLFSRKRTGLRYRYFGSKLPEERLMHVLFQRETTIGRALSNDIILLDTTVSRDHARLILDEHGWFVQNVTENNVVRVNGRIVGGGASAPLQPQDLLVVGNTTLQLVAPWPNVLDASILSDPDIADPSNAKPFAGMDNGNEPEVPSLREAEDLYPYSHGEELRAVSLFQEVSPSWATPSMRAETSFAATDPDLSAQREAEDLIGSSVTMQFAFPRLEHGTRRFLLISGLSLIVVVAVVFLVLSSVNNVLGLAQDGTFNIVTAIIVPLIPALGINILVNFIDRYEREPWFLRLAAFLWGAIIAIPPALFIEKFIDGFVTNLWGLDSQVVLHSFLSGLDAGVTEETVKGLGLLLLFFILRDEFDNITDGIVYGALIGAGFAMVENFFYFLNNTNDMSILIVGRIVLGWFSHSTFTICFGIALGSIRHTRVRWRHVVIPLLGYLLAVGLHTVFDFVDIFVRDMVPTYGNSVTVTRLATLAVIGDYIPPFIVQVGILYILIRSLMHEAAIIREFLISEVADGVVTVDEYVLLPYSFARTRVERRVLWRRGFRQWLLTRALYQTEIGLAFRKWHVSMGDKPKLGYVQPEDAYRKRIKDIRKEIAAKAKEGKANPVHA